MNRYFNLASADIVVPNQDACGSEEDASRVLVHHLLSGHLMWDFNALREIVDTLPGNTPLQNKALVTANAIMNAFKTGDPENIKQLREIAEDVFGKGWQAKGPDIYQEGPEKAQVIGISYCHIVRYQAISRGFANAPHRIQLGCGHTESHSRRPRDHGQLKSTLWNAIRNIDLFALKANNSSG